MNLKKLIPMVAALAAVAAVTASSTSAAASAPVPTGTWSGTTYQNLNGLDHQYTTKLVITAYGGRIQSVTGWVRMECDDASVWDARIGQSFPAGRGPKLSATGHFSAAFKAVGSRQYVLMSGSLLKSHASGAIGASSSEPHCAGRGAWLAKRRF
jgi:hypothetical protein